jgi:hypothetical protein
MLQPTVGLSNKIDHGKKHQSATSQQRAGISPRLSDEPPNVINSGQAAHL